MVDLAIMVGRVENRLRKKRKEPEPTGDFDLACHNEDLWSMETFLSNAQQLKRSYKDIFRDGN